jgi:hypothetical protein
MSGPIPNESTSAGAAALVSAFQSLGVDLDLLVQLEPAAGQGPEHVAHRGFWVCQVALAVERGTGAHELEVARRFQLVTQLVGGGDQR